MKKFAELINKLDSTNKTNAKVAALADYFKNAPATDKVWTIAILSHRRPPRPVNTTLLRNWASELSGIPLWLFEESYHIVGDLAETIALIIPGKESTIDKSLTTYLKELIALKAKTDEEKKAYLFEEWGKMNYYERFAFNKLITGSFRIGISQKLMTRALSEATGIEADILAYKLMGNWDPDKIPFKSLVLETNEGDYLSKPYPFFLAHALEGNPSALGPVEEWAAEHKWDGIRAQLIFRQGALYTWSRGEELVTDKYPEFHGLIQVIPEGTVLDGEILAYPDGAIGTFNDLQARIGRKNVSKKLLENAPVILKVYDILEWKGEDIREMPFSQRREILDSLIRPLLGNPNIPLGLSEKLSFTSWEDVARERGRAREMKSEGLMLKKLDSPYLVGRKKGYWWKWKVDPLTIDAVLTYAMRGHGRRSNLFTDYTFALWDHNTNGEKELVTFAKAYSGLTDAEFRQVDAWIKKNTLERYGPVRSVKPEHVFEIAFEGVAPSKRHKSGVATRFPRILRWRKDKKIDEANTLADLKELIP